DISSNTIVLKCTFHTAHSQHIIRLDDSGEEAPKIQQQINSEGCCGHRKATCFPKGRNLSSSICRKATNSSGSGGATCKSRDGWSNLGKNMILNSNSCSIPKRLFRK